MNKVVLFDRDGTLIIDPPDERVTNEDKISLFRDSIPALSLLAKNGYQVIIITNQAGISEARISISDFERINTEVIRRLTQSGVTILNTFMCPHGPYDACECRKPKPKMILDAARDYGLDLSKTYMVGDHRSDVLAGKAAGAMGILVETANRQDSAPEAKYVAKDLTAAIEYIIRQGQV